MTEEILKATAVLRSGGTMLYPTDTIWGIGCDATNYRAVEKICQLKKRTAQKSFIILLDQPEKLAKYVDKVPDIIWDLLPSIDYPLTVIYPGAKNLPKNVVAADQSVAIRIVKDAFCKELVSFFGKPIVSTSANFADEPTPLMFSHISKELINKVDHVVNLNRDKLNTLKPSMIIRVRENGTYEVLRS
ncbi:MAG TPA: L-threonylcarbamoyladenylate synthase [Bacteroidales bacterium]|nr:L-threonylcarbamoyladenylate synthase [Bacteroidales bacterium]